MTFSNLPVIVETFFIQHAALVLFKDMLYNVSDL